MQTLSSRSNVRLWHFSFVLFFPLAMLFSYIGNRDPQWTEQYFSQGFYPFIMKCISGVSSLFPFSLFEVCLVAGLVLAVLYTALRIRTAIREQERRLEQLLRWVCTFLNTVSILLFLFVITCGMNYNRLPFATFSGLTVRDSSTQELLALCEELVVEANAARALVAEDANGVFTLRERDMYVLSNQSRGQFEKLGELYPILGGRYSQPKPLLFSEVMSHARFTGNFSGYFGEPCINVNAPDVNIPFTMFHEQAHLRGFMREDEANFIGYLAGANSDNPDMRYSCIVMAYSRAASSLRRSNPEAYVEVWYSLSEGVQRDLRDDAAYWAAHDTSFATAASTFNDTYLKVNNQSDGVQSYGRMVDLLLADYRERHGLV